MNVLLKKNLQEGSLFAPTWAKIIDVHPLTQLEKLFSIELPYGTSLDHKPGQFVQVSIMGVGEAPISISSSPSRSNGFFELCVRKAGDLTGVLHRMDPGDLVGIRGPFGRGFPIERFHGKDVLLAPGGLGLAPLRSLINQILDERTNFGRVIILYGARNPSELLFCNELEAWGNRDDIEMHITVDRPEEHWKGNVGVITTLFPKVQIYAPNTVAITCGPPVMYRYVLMELQALGIRDGNIWLSLERRMKCGIGKCGHCQINHIYACQEGPVFSYAEIKHMEDAL